MGKGHPLKFAQKVIFLGLDGKYHVAKVVTVTDSDNCFAKVHPADSSRHLKRDTTQSWRGGHYFIEMGA